MRIRLSILLCLVLLTGYSPAAEYRIDTEGAHAFIHFRIQHLGYSWLWGRFERFEGRFSYDETDPDSAEVEVSIDMTSLDSNHAERDRHLRGDRFLDADRYPRATFKSSSYREQADGSGELTGELSLHGVTRSIRIGTRLVGAGRDPWGGYRRGFEGHTSLRLADFGIDYDLGPHSKEVELMLSVEGILQRGERPGPRN